MARFSLPGTRPWNQPVGRGPERNPNRLEEVHEEQTVDSRGDRLPGSGPAGRRQLPVVAAAAYRDQAPGAGATIVTADFLARLRRVHGELGIPATFLDQPRLPLCVEPDELVDSGQDFFNRPQRLLPAARDAWEAMRAAAGREGVELHLVSAFRGIDYQRDLIRRHLDNGRSLADILQVVAPPGFSEHHTGRAIDLTSADCEPLTEAFEDTAAFRWLTAHAGQFDFTMSYPRENPYGIAYEPWHWCFRG